MAGIRRSRLSRSRVFTGLAFAEAPRSIPALCPACVNPAVTCRWHAVCPGLVAHDLSGLCRRDRMLPEVRMARIIDAIGLHQAKKLSCVEAAELLGMSERHFRRLRDAYEAHGAEGIVDRRRGRASGRRAPVDEVAWVVEE